MQMKAWVWRGALVWISMFCIAQEATHSPASFDLQCDGSDCLLLKGSPQTTGMRSGFVKLKPGESVGEHSTGDHEEALVVLLGEGQAKVEGHEALLVSAGKLIYIPPRSRHNVTNTGKEMLEYVYVVAPVGKG